MKKPKPPVLHTREAMEATVGEYVRLKLTYLSAVAANEAEKAEVDKRNLKRLNGLMHDIERACAAVQNYCSKHRSELLPDQRKSFDTLNAVVGFRDNPMRTEKTSTKETWEQIAMRLSGLEFMTADNSQVELACIDYVREPALQVNKEALLADRARFSAQHLRAMGIRFEQDEVFYIDPKSEIVEGDTKAA